MAYTDPTPAVLKTDFPEMVVYDDPSVQRAINVAKRMVDTSWTEGDYTRAIELYACHILTSGGAGAGNGSGGGGGGSGGGVISSESLGPIAVSYDTKAASGEGGYADPFGLKSTIYGKEFAMLQQLNRGGVRTTGQLCAGAGSPFRIYGGNDEGWGV